MVIITDSIKDCKLIDTLMAPILKNRFSFEYVLRAGERDRKPKCSFIIITLFHKQHGDYGWDVEDCLENYKGQTIYDMRDGKVYTL